MTNTEGTGSAQPGWYPDPAGTTQLRWWDGTRWTDYLQPAPGPAQPVAPPQPAAAQPGYEASDTGAARQNPYAAGLPAQPALGPNPAIYTPFIWIITLLPLLSAIAFAAYDMRVRFTIAGNHNPMINPMLTDPMYIVVSLLGWVIYGVSVWMAYLDWRALERIGIVRPFHWAWAFLGGIVYVIGRSIVVHRRVGNGLLPIWIAIGVYVVWFIVLIVKIGMLLSSIVSLYNR